VPIGLMIRCWGAYIFLQISLKYSTIGAPVPADIKGDVPNGIPCHRSSPAGTGMFRKSDLRLIGLNIVLIALTIQGLTPDPYNLVSPLAFQWLDSFAASGDHDPLHSQSPAKNRPAPSPSSEEGTPEEVALPGEPREDTILRRRLAEATNPPLTSIGSNQHLTRPDPPFSGRSRRPTELVRDRISSLCRLTC
jgi:hypothetical protein